MKKLLLMLLFVCFSGGANLLYASNALAPQNHEWETFSSCNQVMRVFGEQLEADQLETERSIAVSDFTDHSLITSSKNQVSFDDFLALYQPSAHQIALIKSPQSSMSVSVNIQLPKVFGKIRFSSNFSDISLDRYEDLLIIYSQYKKVDSLVMIYRIEGEKIFPVKYFQIGGAIQLSKINGNRLYFVTKKSYSSEGLSPEALNTLKVESLLPYFFEAKDYSLAHPEARPIDCRTIHYPKSMIGTHGLVFTNIAMINLKALERGAVIASFFGALEQAFLEGEFLYLTHRVPALSGVLTAFDQFALEPAINYVHSQYLSGTIPSQPLAYDSKKNLLLWGITPSGMMEMYSLSPDSFHLSRFPSSLAYATPVFSNPIWYLSMHDKFNIALVGNVQVLSLGTVVKEEDEQLRFPLDSNKKLTNQLSFLTLGERDQHLYVKVIRLELPNPQHCLNNACANMLIKKQVLTVGFYKDELGIPFAQWSDISYFDSSKKILYFPLMLRDSATQELVFNGIKALTISSDQQLQELFSRDYQSVLKSKALSTLDHGEGFIFTSSPGFFDLFVITDPKKMKVLKY